MKRNASGMFLEDSDDSNRDSSEFSRELFKEKAPIGDIKGLYQFKKLPSLSLVYLTPWSSGNNSVKMVNCRA
ncbi:hypothetical protein WN944_026897 [Citrus x changshan-huyou]|uniref:Uncharacterized protein n=1 Tax=Citrus x changshan-huyou TaxID=2935761 RepID=A0AAP0LGI7_9ROSI